MIKYIFLVLLGSSLFLACSNEPNPQKIIDQSIEKSGGAIYENSLVQFDFRSHHYLVERNKDSIKMMRIKKDDSTEVKDVMNYDSFQRYINNEPVFVHDTMIFKYKESINSVIYFALLPFRLNDAAVKKKYLGMKHIDNKDYHKIQISFEEEGGGVDFEDIYVYWIDSKGFNIGFLAYSFKVNGGGYRFRKAYNERKVGGIRFADYINYKPGVETESVSDLDELYMNNQLLELSKIELTNIAVSSPTF